MSVIAALTDKEIVQLATRAKVQALAREMEKFPQIECPLFHHFIPGLYIRELHIPKDALTVSKIHKLPSLNILSKGERATLIDDQFVRIKAPHIHWSPAGHQRFSYTYEDSVWVTMHLNPRNEKNVATLEKELAAETEEEYRDFIKFLEMEGVPA